MNWINRSSVDLGVSSGLHEKKPFPELITKNVSQNKHVDEQISPFDNHVHMIHTVSRIGCDAVLMVTVEDNGTEHVCVTHYDPEHVEEHTQLIREKSELHPIGQRYGVLLTRGERGSAWSEKLKTELALYLGKTPDMVSMPNLGLEHAAEIARRENELNYQLVYVRGFGGNMKNHRINIPGSSYDKTFIT